MRTIQELMRPNIARLKPYSSARDEYTGEAKVFLDANENPFPSAFNRYPDPQQRVLKGAIAKWRKVPANSIFLGNGSDEAIDLLLRAFCEPGQDRIVVCPPTYGMYAVSAGIQDAEILSVPLLEDAGEGFQPDLESLQPLFGDPRNKLLFLCSPNNPTGNLLKRQKVEEILRSFPGLVVLDEAYIDFASGASMLPVLAEFPNLVILQTFSKAWGLAGLRLGMAFASAEILAVLNKIKAPYNLNRFIQEYALDALGRIAEMQSGRNQILNQREMLRERLLQNTLVEMVYPSDANFLLVRFKTPKKVFETLREKGIIVRDRTSQVENCLRITVGSEAENRELLDELERIDKLQIAPKS
jgi:histidinol-phosphate aminotransferase